MPSLPEQNSPARKQEMQAHLDFLRRCAAAAADSTEQIIKLNVSTARASVERSAAAVQQALVGDPRELIALAAHAQEHVDSMLAYGRQLMGIATGAQAALLKPAAAAPAPAPAPVPTPAPSLEAAPATEPAPEPAQAKPKAARALRKPAPAVKPAPPPADVAAPKPIAKAAGKVAKTVAAKPAAAPFPTSSTRPVEVSPVKPIESTAPPAPKRVDIEKRK